jgi:hypothetical protein
MAEIREKRADMGPKRGHVNNGLVTCESARIGPSIRHAAGLPEADTYSLPCPREPIAAEIPPGRNKIPVRSTSRPQNVPSSACLILGFMSPFQCLADSPRWKLGLGSQSLAAGQVLIVDVLDFTRAGMFDPRRPALTGRIYRDSTPPRLTVRYRLIEQNSVVVRGEERLVNVDYLALPTGRLNSDPLGYEKALIGDWFRSRVVERHPPPA